jgi:hypothetical protein
MNVISESLSNVNKQSAPIMAHLKTLVDYRKELYKLELRQSVISQMPPNDTSQLPQIKKKYAQVNPGKSFYPDLAEEIIKEDFTSGGPALREKILASLQVAENKPKAVKQQVSFKTILLEGIQCIGGTAQTFMDVSGKLEENRNILESEKKGLWISIKKVVRQMLNKEPEPVIYVLNYIDPIKGVPIQEKVNVNVFQSDLSRKIKILTSMGSRGAGMAKLEAMQDEQIISFLEKNIRDLQSYHKTLTALDEFFKGEVEKDHRDKIKGIKPELGTIKNAIIRANSRRHEYSAQKEEEEQLKRLGVNPGAQGS